VGYADKLVFITGYSICMY